MAQIHGHETKYFFNRSDIVLSLAENSNHHLDLLFWNEIAGTFTISIRSYALATIGNIILSFPGFWIGMLLAMGFWFISKHISSSEKLAGKYFPLNIKDLKHCQPKLYLLSSTSIILLEFCSYYNTPSIIRSFLLY